MLQNAMLAKIGPKALARAPNERNIPITVPFSFSDPFMDAIVIKHG